MRSPDDVNQKKDCLWPWMPEDTLIAYLADKLLADAVDIPETCQCRLAYTTHNITCQCTLVVLHIILCNTSPGDTANNNAMCVTLLRVHSPFQTSTFRIKSFLWRTRQMQPHVTLVRMGYDGVLQPGSQKWQKQNYCSDCSVEINLTVTLKVLAQIDLRSYEAVWGRMSLTGPEEEREYSGIQGKALAAYAGRMQWREHSADGHCTSF